MAAPLLYPTAMNRHRLASLLAVLAVIAVTRAAPAVAGSPPHKLDKVLQAAAAEQAGGQRVIIRTVPGVRGDVREWLRGAGRTVHADHPAIGALAVYVDASDLQVLADDPRVVSVSVDAVVRASAFDAFSFAYAGQDPPGWLRQTLGVNRGDSTGEGVGVAIVDSGIQPSTDFAGRLTSFYDFTQGGVRATAPYDDYGHGTHVAGLVGGSGLLSAFAYQGVAPGVRLIGLKVLDRHGRATRATSSRRHRVCGRRNRRAL